MILDARFDKGALQRVVERLRKQSPRAVRAAVGAMGKAALGLVRRGWQRQANPYGSAWAPKKRPDGNPILVRTGTGRLRGSFRLVMRGLAFSVMTGTAYALFHQFGTSRMVARKMLPDGRGLPADWRAVIVQAGERALKAAMR